MKIFISTFIFEFNVSLYQCPQTYIYFLEPFNFRTKQVFYRRYTCSHHKVFQKLCHKVRVC